MSKKISFIVVSVLAAIVVIGCAAKEDDSNIPVGKPGDGGPQPTNVTGVGGTAPASGGAQAPVTQ